MTCSMHLNAAFYSLIGGLLLTGTGAAAEPAKTYPNSQEFYDQAVADSAGKKWQPLFNGQNLDGWKIVLANDKPGQDPEKIFQVSDGIVHVYRDTPAGKKMPFGVIVTDKSYSNYRFKFEYKWGEKKFAPRVDRIRDAGMLFHVVGPEKIWPMSVECQVQEKDVGDTYLVYTLGDSPVDNTGKKFQDVSQGGTFQSFNQPGKITRIIKSETPEHDGWNTVEVIVRGDAAVYLVNGTLNNYLVNIRAPLGPDNALIPLTSGRIALQCEGAELYYRHIELMDLQPEKTARFVPADESIAPVAPLDPQQGLAAWKVRKGFRVELVAAEPLLMDPVAIDWGLDGRLWVAEMADYPLGMDGKGKSGGRIRVLEKSDPDGPYNRSTVFLEGLNFPNGIVTWKEGVIVTAAPEIFYAADTDGDGICDRKTILFSGFHEGNQQLRMNGLRWGLDGWLHCASGSHTPNYGKQSQVHGHLTGKDIPLGSRDFRFHPATGELEPLSGPSQFGRNNDDWGNWFGVQNSYPLWHYVLDDAYLRRNSHLIIPEARKLLTESNPRVFPVAEIRKQPNPHTRVGRFTSACSGMVYRDQWLNWGDDQAHAFTCEPVHNLVQHNVLFRDGESFHIERDVSGETPDFLASTDSWCRPVMVRTGPDGALWVVDMYRYLIEHPQWVPAAAQKEIAPYLRLGDGRGRLYRIVPEQAPARTIPDIRNASAQELVALLEHPNGWIRDAVQQKLMTSTGTAAVPLLKDLLRTTPHPRARLHAMYTLHAIRPGLDSSELTALLNDSSPDIRRHALKLAERHSLENAALATAIRKCSTDPDAAVRLQLACSLGEWKSPIAVQLLSDLLKNPESNFWMTAALFSSLNDEKITPVIDAFNKLSLEQPVVQKRYADLLGQAVAFGVRAPIQENIRASQAENENFARALISLAAVDKSPHRVQILKSLDANAVTRIHRQAREMLSAQSAPSWMLAMGVELLFHRPDGIVADQELVATLLGQTISSDLASALVRHLGRQRGPEYGKIMLMGWPGYLPAVRNLAMEVWASRPEWHPLLLEAIDKEIIHPQEISLSLQQQFVANGKSATARGLQERFEATRTNGLQSAVRSEILKLAGNVTRGREVFRKNCVDCHQFQGQGIQVGPNLASITGRTPENLLDAILTPNQAIEPKYLSYAVAMEDGRTLSGIIDSDSGNSLVLLKAKGERTPILRNEIEELRSTGKSLMPEGFDKTISSQELADLIRYLQLSDNALSAAGGKTD